MIEILTFGRYLHQKFGKKVYKVPISLPGFTCPNIDGSVTIGGCTFCDNESFSPNLNRSLLPKRETLNQNSTNNPYLQMQLLTLEAQFAKTSTQLANKFKADAFLVYFQSFSNTYAPLETLKALYEKALSFDKAIGLSIGTRSDCISEDIADYLAQLSETHEIWIEFGIQSIYDQTLLKINRGHDFENVKNAIEICKKRGLKICGHLIFGLPGESKEMMLSSVEESIKLGIDSLKFHPAYVVKNTALANDIRSGKYSPISEEDFLDVLVKAIKMLPSDISIQRISAGINDESLIAPTWCGDKNSQMINARNYLLSHGMIY